MFVARVIGRGARSAVLLLLLPWVAGCGGGSSAHRGPKQPSGIADLSCDQLVLKGTELVDRGKNADGRQYLRRYEQRCAKEPRIEEAKLKICESFLKESTADLKAEGVAVCRQIITFYPNHAVACSAQFRIAQYYFEQMRSCERDQTDTIHTVEELQKLIASYPKCELVGQAQEKLGAAYARLACAEFKVAEYYQRVNEPRAALHRLDDLLRKYPDFPDRCKARRMQIELAVNQGKLEDARANYAQMQQDCAGTEDLSEARGYVGIASTIKK